MFFGQIEQASSVVKAYISRASDYERWHSSIMFEYLIRTYIIRSVCTGQCRHLTEYTNWLTSL